MFFAAIVPDLIMLEHNFIFYLDGLLPILFQATRDPVLSILLFVGVIQSLLGGAPSMKQNFSASPPTTTLRLPDTCSRGDRGC